MKKLVSLVPLMMLLLAASVNAQGIKWHPGHYIQLLTDESRAQVLEHIDEIGAVPSIKGVQVRIRWYAIEKSKGVYDFSDIDAYLARLKAQPTRKQLVVRIIDRKFNTDSPAGIVPNYLHSSTYAWGLAESKTGYVAKLWKPAVMDRLIALHRAIATRYDGDSHFEGLTSEETTLGLAKPYWDYSNEALVIQYRRLINAVRNAAPHSNFFLYTNWIGSAALMDDLMQGLMGSRGAAGGPDAIPARKTLAQQVWTGDYGGDYRWELALASSVEVEDLKGNTPQEINDWAYNELHVQYIFWLRNTWAGDSSRRWDTGILPFLRTNPPVRTRCPNSYGWCMN